MAKGAALITGASSGIGAELARLCAADGYAVILVARREERLAQLAENLTREFGVAARGMAVDLADAAACQSLRDQTRDDRVEILVNNAGFGLRGPYTETDWKTEARLIEVNMIALAHLTKLFARDMLQRGSGKILNVGSTAAFVPGPFMAMYYASKAFVVSFSLSVANELQGSGVSVTVLCPGPTSTEFGTAAGLGRQQTFQGSRDDRRGRCPGRICGHDGGQGRSNRRSTESLDDSDDATGSRAACWRELPGD